MQCGEVDAKVVNSRTVSAYSGSRVILKNGDFTMVLGTKDVYMILYHSAALYTLWTKYICIEQYKKSARLLQ